MFYRIVGQYDISYDTFYRFVGRYDPRVIEEEKGIDEQWLVTYAASVERAFSARIATENARASAENARAAAEHACAEKEKEKRLLEAEKTRQAEEATKQKQVDFEIIKFNAGQQRRRSAATPADNPALTKHPRTTGMNLMATLADTPNATTGRSRPTATTTRAPLATIGRTYLTTTPFGVPNDTTTDIRSLQKVTSFNNSNFFYVDHCIDSSQYPVCFFFLYF